MSAMNSSRLAPNRPPNRNALKHFGGSWGHWLEPGRGEGGGEVDGGGVEGGAGRMLGGARRKLNDGATAYVYIPHGPFWSPVICTRMKPLSPHPVPKLHEVDSKRLSDTDLKMRNMDFFE